ncbi:hypothetical protein GQ55_3G033400 [Panicum hallii var. hallii]|uniref:Uncharacterized protein n=1 Tax=Panicum hallii var. hallii TaxID=1504633 RepID=A0A2T7E5B7_9POAL|nr:hypothetical protein GQ55_3G033400 [Panicum hallii var. hallii]
MYEFIQRIRKGKEEEEEEEEEVDENEPKRLHWDHKGKGFGRGPRSAPPAKRALRRTSIPSGSRSVLKKASAQGKAASAADWPEGRRRCLEGRLRRGCADGGA